MTGDSVDLLSCPATPSHSTATQQCPGALAPSTGPCGEGGPATSLSALELSHATPGRPGKSLCPPPAAEPGRGRRSRSGGGFPDGHRALQDEVGG